MASHFHNNSSELALCNNENKELNTIKYDLFTEFGIYINKNIGFEVFNNYFKNTQKFKLELDFMLNEYYEYLLEKNTRKIQETLQGIMYMFYDFRETFLEYENEYFLEKFSIYLNDKKKNMNDLNPDISLNFVISNLQFEWILILENLKNLFNNVVKQNDSKLKKSNSIFDRIQKALKNTFNTNTHNFNYAIKNI